MPEKYGLKKMLAEIQEDDAAEDTKHRKLSREDVRRRVAKRGHGGGQVDRER
jgi:hypothetical protein